MKRVIILVGIILMLVLCSGCKANNDNISNKDSQPQILGIKDYYPIKENTKYVYQGQGNEYASYYVYVDYASDSKVQQRVNNGGTEMAKVIELKDGKLARVFTRGEAYYRENLLDAKSNDGEILLMEPLTKGTSWTLKDSSVRTITGTSIDVTTPLGTYKAIEVTTQSKDSKTLDYYAKGVGLVKSIFISGGTQISSSLSKIEENVPLVQKINFYYPNVDDGKIYYKAKDVSFKTNDVTKKVLEGAYKEVINNAVGKVFSANTKINSLYLNNDNMVYIDLNRAFLTEMNAGSGYEGMILQCIANTFGQYYNSDKVVLSIDNQPYESGHILMKKGEYIKVKYDGVVEVK